MVPGRWSRVVALVVVLLLAAASGFSAGRVTLRPAAEDLIGAGAILDRLPGHRSPEAELAVAAFRAARGRLPDFLLASSSGREHAAKGTEGDVVLAAQLDVSDFAPRLVAGAYVAGAGDGY